MKHDFCSVLAKAEGEPLHGSAPEKDSAIFFPAQKTEWHRNAAREMLHDLPEDCDLKQAVESFSNPLICYYAPNSATGNDIFVADLTEIKCFSSEGLFIDREIRHLYAICTDGKKDACCAKFGIPVARAFFEECGADKTSIAFESSHIGGCRFAATAVCFPSGNSYGRILQEDTKSIRTSEQRGLIVPHIFRGNVFVSEIHCWIMSHCMEKFGYVPKEEDTEIVKEEGVFHIAIKSNKGVEYKFDLVEHEYQCKLYSGCANIESGRSITRLMFDFVSSDY